MSQTCDLIKYIFPGQHSITDLSVGNFVYCPEDLKKLLTE